MINNINDFEQSEIKLDKLTNKQQLIFNKNKFIRNFFFVLYVYYCVTTYLRYSSDDKYFQIFMVLLFAGGVSVISSILFLHLFKNDYYKLLILMHVNIIGAIIVTLFLYLSTLETSEFLIFYLSIGVANLYNTRRVSLFYSIVVLSLMLSMSIVGSELIFGFELGLANILAVFGNIIFTVFLLYHSVSEGISLRTSLRGELSTIKNQSIQLEAILYNIIDTFEHLTAEHDEDTGKHNQRIKLFAVELAEKIGCEKIFIEELSLGAPLHDLGKIYLDRDILFKQGKLTDEERLYVREHVLKGCKTIEKLKLGKVVENIVLHHHESWDGKGYPSQLKGIGIPLEARIITICDVYDALRSSRAYKRTWSHKEASDYLIANSGILFDPELIDVFVNDSSEIFNKIFNEN